MRSVTGFVQAEAKHIRQSELCASCHTLITEAFGPSGEVIGSLPEQMNYQEWQHSAFSKEERSCQSCHMPAAPGPVRTSSVLGDTRDTMAQHVFVGGNAFMVRMLNRYRTELGVTALPSELEATARATIRQLQQDTATLSLSDAAVDRRRTALHRGGPQPDRAQVPDRLPVPAHVAARDGARCAARRSSNRAPSTSTDAIAGNDNDADPKRFEPHYAEITRPDQVQIYEPILGDRDRRSDDGPADGDTVSERQPSPAAGVRQDDGGGGDRRVRRGRERRGLRERRRSRPLRSHGSGVRDLPGRGGASVPDDRLQVGSQPGWLRRS